MIRVAVGGATGKLGRMVCDMILRSDDMELTGALVSPNGGNVGMEIFPGIVARGPADIGEILNNADVYVDLTSPDAAASIIPSVPEAGVNLILGTTAVNADAVATMAENVRKNNTSALVSANFSMGVNVFWNVSENMAGMLEGYDIELMEKHHASKRDAPSGTTAEALRRILDKVGERDVTHGRSGIVGRDGIGVHSVRAGGIVGEHAVLFANDTEMIEIRHTTLSRKAYADGCIECIRWMHGRSDGRIHTMDEVLGI